MESGSAITVMYAPLPTGGTYATVGARLTCEWVTNEALVEKLMEIMPPKSSLIYEVTLIRPIGELCPKDYYPLNVMRAS